MIKSIKAFLKGYTYFEVNDNGFWTYDKADAYCICLRHVYVMAGIERPIAFTGFNIYRMRWECFYMKAYSGTLPTLFTQALQ